MQKVSTIARIVWLEMLRRKDVYVLLILLGGLLLALVSLNVFGVGGMVRYVADVGLLLAWAFGWVLAVNISARQLPQEESRRTIFPMLAKPITRFEFLLGKWVGSWSIACVSVLLFYALVAAVVQLKGGALNTAALLQGYLLHCAALAVVSSLAVGFSTRMATDAAAALTYVLTGAAFLVVPRVGQFIVYQKGVQGVALLVLYHLLPHFEIFDMRKRVVHDYGPATATAFGAALLYGAVLTAFFILLAWLGYRKKRFSRSSV